MNTKDLGIYIHIPFCVKKCRYCDFCSMPSSDLTKENYIRSLKNDIEKLSENFKSYNVNSIYFGGGTPTCINSNILVSVLDCVFFHYNVSNDAEISLECNPATANYNDLRTLKSGGFNRLSMGLQSIHKNELSELGRIHTFEDFDYTYNQARKAGFKNINVDLMYGIPLQSEESFEKTLNTLISYNPEHISCYALRIEPNTDFYKNKEKLILPDEDSEYNMYIHGIESLKLSGYNHYEISNFSKPGKESVHNLKYWNCDDYLGIGVSAHSCINHNRYYVKNSIPEYIKSSEENISNHFSVEEILNDKQFIEEYIMMRMRLGKGISLSEFEKKFNTPIDQKYLQRMKKFIKSGHIINSDDNYHFSDEGMFVSNYLLTEILDLN